MQLTLPYPPSVNRYWRHWRGRTVLNQPGREFRRAVCGSLGGGGNPPFTGRVALAMDAFPPDRRRRDLDNILKASCDSLAHAGIYDDDSQIDLLIVRRRQPTKNGKLEIVLDEFPLSRCPLCGGTLGEENLS